MSKGKSFRKIDYPSAKYLFSQLSPAAQRRFLELQLARDFPAFCDEGF